MKEQACHYRCLHRSITHVESLTVLFKQNHMLQSQQEANNMCKGRQEEDKDRGPPDPQLKETQGFAVNHLSM